MHKPLSISGFLSSCSSRMTRRARRSGASAGRQRQPGRLRKLVQRYLPATNMLAQTTLRAVLGQHELNEMLSERKKLSVEVQSILDAQTET